MMKRSMGERNAEEPSLSDMDWIEQGLRSHSTHLSHFGDGGVIAASARIVAAVRAHSVYGVE